MTPRANMRSFGTHSTYAKQAAPSSTARRAGRPRKEAAAAGRSFAMTSATASAAMVAPAKISATHGATIGW